MDSIGSRVKQLRKELHLSQDEFGRRVETSYGHISNIERGKTQLSDRMIRLICEEFNVSKEWLEKGIEPKYIATDLVKRAINSIENKKDQFDVYKLLWSTEYSASCYYELEKLLYPVAMDITGSLYYKLKDSPELTDLIIYMIDLFYPDGISNSLTIYEKGRLMGKLETMLPDLLGRVAQLKEQARTIRQQVEHSQRGKELQSLCDKVFKQEFDVIDLPVIGNTAAGTPIAMIREYDVEHFSSQEVKGDDFIVRAIGDSMVNAGINDGDLVLIRPIPAVDHGEIALVSIDDASTIKRFYRKNGSIHLVPENSAHTEQVYDKNTNIRVLGKFIKVIKKQD